MTRARPVDRDGHRWTQPYTLWSSPKSQQQAQQLLLQAEIIQQLVILHDVDILVNSQLTCAAAGSILNDIANKNPKD